MRRSIVLTAVLSSVVSLAGAAMLGMLVLPSLVEAQVARTVAQGITVQRADGLTGVTADVRPTGGGLLQVLGVDGKTVRVTVASGGAGQNGQPNPRGAGLNVFGEAGDTGPTVARLGTATTTGRPQMFLQDSQNRRRFEVTLDEDGNAYLEIRDADGNVVWSAP